MNVGKQVLHQGEKKTDRSQAAELSVAKLWLGLRKATEQHLETHVACKWQ